MWLQRQVSGEHPVLGPYWGLELWAYDSTAEHYVKYWFDNQSPHAFVNRGGWVNPNRLELHGQIASGDTTIYLKNVYALRPDGSFTWTHYQSRGDAEHFEQRGASVYTRSTVR